jgi:excisionase family DNA binding protein
MQDLAADDSPKLLSGFLTLDQLAAELGRSPRTVQRWLSLREGPIRARRKVGRSVYFRRQDVVAWLAAEPAAEKRRGR